MYIIYIMYIRYSLKDVGRFFIHMTGQSDMEKAFGVAVNPPSAGWYSIMFNLILALWIPNAPNISWYLLRSDCPTQLMAFLSASYGSQRWPVFQDKTSSQGVALPSNVSVMPGPCGTVATWLEVLVRYRPFRGILGVGTSSQFEILVKDGKRIKTMA